MLSRIDDDFISTQVKVRLVRPLPMTNANKLRKNIKLNRKKLYRKNIEDKLKKALGFEVQVSILESQISRHSENFFEITCRLFNARIYNKSRKLWKQ